MWDTFACCGEGGVAHGRYNNQWCLKSFSNFWHRYSHSLFYQYSLLLVCEFHQIDLPDGERGAQAHRLTPPQNPHTDACMIHSQCNSGQVWNQKSQYYYFRVWNVLNCLMWYNEKSTLDYKHSKTVEQGTKWHATWPNLFCLSSTSSKKK